MRVIIFALLILFFSCSSDSKSTAEEKSSIPQKEQSGVVLNPEVEDGVVLKKMDDEPVDPDQPVTYKKTATTHSEFAVFNTISVNGDFTEYYFKTLDGIRIIFTVSIEGEPEVKVPKNLLEDVKYQVGHPGANSDMVGEVFEIIYDKDNVVAEVKLAEKE